MLLVDHGERLRAERAEAERRLSGLDGSYAEIVAASRDTNADDEHDPEGATIAFERSQTGALAEAARAHLVEIDAALTRLAEGHYGVCERCAAPISSERLGARPTARHCIGCAAKS